MNCELYLAFRSIFWDDLPTRTLDTGIVGNGLAWDANGAADNVNANLLVLVGTCHVQQVGDATQQGDTATGDDALFDGGASGAQGILG